jgi:hypothetical protein
MRGKKRREKLPLVYLKCSEVREVGIRIVGIEYTPVMKKHNYVLAETIHSRWQKEKRGKLAEHFHALSIGALALLPLE